MLSQQSGVDQKLLGGCFFSVVLTLCSRIGLVLKTSSQMRVASGPDPSPYRAYPCLLLYLGRGHLADGGKVSRGVALVTRSQWRISQHSALCLLRGSTMGTRVQIGVSSGAELHATGTPGTPGVPGCRGWSMPTTPWSQHPLRCCFSWCRPPGGGGAAASMYGNRCVPPSYALPSRARDKRTAAELLHRCTNESRKLAGVLWDH